MDLFYDSLDPTSIASVAKWLAAFAARLALTFVTAMAHTDIRQRLLLTASQIWVLCLVLAGYAAVHFLPGLGQVAGVVDALLLAIGAVELLGRLQEIAASLTEGIKRAYAARSEADLEEAGKALAPALSASVVTAIEALVVWRAFVAVEAAALRRFPMPEWLESKLSRALKREEPLPERGPPSGRAESSAPPNQSVSAERVGPEPNQSRISEPEPRQSRAPEAEPRQSRAPEREPGQTPGSGAKRGKAEPTPGRTARAVAKGTARLEGTRKTAEVASGLGWELALGAVAVVGLTAGVVLLATSGRRT